MKGGNIKCFGVSQQIVLLDALGVEDDHAATPHVEGDDGAWVEHYGLPEVGVGVVGVFDDEHGVGGDGVHGCFVVLGCRCAFVGDDDDGVVAVVVAYAE